MLHQRRWHRRVFPPITQHLPLLKNSHRILQYFQSGETQKNPKSDILLAPSAASASGLKWTFGFRMRSDGHFWPPRAGREAPLLRLVAAAQLVDCFFCVHFLKVCGLAFITRLPPKSYHPRDRQTSGKIFRPLTMPGQQKVHGFRIFLHISKGNLFPTIPCEETPVMKRGCFPALFLDPK